MVYSKQKAARTCFMATSHWTNIFLENIALVFQLIGVGALVIGCMYTFYYVLTESKDKRLRNTPIDYIRLELGRSIALSLEFFVAADIIRTIVTPDYYQIGILSILVVVRTILTYFLRQELAGLESQP